jgi:hypothetical protein
MLPRRPGVWEETPKEGERVRRSKNRAKADDPAFVLASKMRQPASPARGRADVPRGRADVDVAQVDVDVAHKIIRAIKQRSLN